MRDIALQKKKKGVKEAGGGWVPALRRWKERHVLQAGTKRDSEDFGEYISEELTSPSDSHGGCDLSDNFLTLLGRASSQHRLDPYQRLELRRSPRHFSSCPLNVKSWPTFCLLHSRLPSSCQRCRIQYQRENHRNS